MPEKYDVVIIGSGPNGLAAAITLAQAGRSVIVFEAKDTIGGGVRTKEATLPGFKHDICSAIHPLAFGSPFFRTLSLEQHGLEWIHPPYALAHPFDDGHAVLLSRSIEETASNLAGDAAAYIKLMNPVVQSWPEIEPALLGPLKFPAHPLSLARFGLKALFPVEYLAKTVFRAQYAKGFLAGLAAHSMLSLNSPATSAFGLILAASGHMYGWPFPRGGSQQIANALAQIFMEMGGEIQTNTEITSLDSIPDSTVILADITPGQLLHIAGNHLPPGYKRGLERYRYGPGVFKIDYALDAPIPWKSPDCALAGTVHLGGTLEEIAASEKIVWQGKTSEQPFVILAQQSLFDPTRAPDGKHTAWAYCHVPSNSNADMTEQIENQIERFAPGFRKHILARHTMKASELEAYNPNYIGGDINGGVQDIRQLFTRPMLRTDPYATPNKKLFICSSSTPPGGGVHGMCGYHAAQSALKKATFK